MALLRLGVAAALAGHALLYRSPSGVTAPSYVKAVALALAIALGLTAVVQLRSRTSRRVALASMAVDVVVATALLLLYDFDPRGYLFVLVIPVQAAATVLLGLPGGLAVWGSMSVASGASGVLADSLYGVSRATADVAILAGLLVVLVTGTLVGALERERRWSTSLLETAPDAVVVTNSAGKVVLANDQAEAMFGYPRRDLVGQFIEVLIPGHLEGKGPSMIGEHTHTPDQGLRNGFELCGRRSDGTEFPVEVSAGVLAGAESFVTTVVRDVTGRKASEQRLRQTEERYRLTVEHMHDVVYMLDTSGDQPTPVLVDGRVQELTGCDPEEFLNEPGLWFELVSAEDRGAAQREATQIFSTKAPIVRKYRMQNRKTGDQCWIEDRSFPEVDESGQVIHVFGVARDITDSRRAETARRKLAAQVTMAHEEERQRVALDIHDDTIQQMVAVELRLQMLETGTQDPTTRETLHGMSEMVRGSVGRLRHLIFDLLPPALEREGLEAALRNYLQETSREAGFDYSVENRLAAEPPVETRTVAYRISQEVIVNVRKHARATRVDILLESENSGLLVRVKDDGSGFDPQSVETPVPGHVGLAAVRERAEILGGWFRIDSGPGRGTTVEFWLPDEP